MKQSDPRHIQIKKVLDYLKTRDLQGDGLNDFILHPEIFPDDELLDKRLRGLTKHIRSLRSHLKIHLNRLAKEVGEEKPYEI